MNAKWVEFCLGDDVYGIEIEYVREMVALMPIRSVPRQPPEQLGVAILRNEVLPVMCSRKILGHKDEHPSKKLVALLEARAQDHINWIKELEASVRESREFKLALDPTQCKFGKWYATFETDDPKLRLLLKQASIPHNKIHELGRQVVDCVKQNTCQEAMKLISEHRETTLAKLMSILDEAIQLVRSSTRQVVIVLEGGDKVIGLSVDSLHSVVQIDESEIQKPDETADFVQFEALRGYWIQPKTGKITRLLDVRKLYPSLAENFDI